MGTGLRLSLILLALVLSGESNLAQAQDTQAQSDQAEAENPEELERAAASEAERAQELERQAAALNAEIAALRENLIAAAERAQNLESLLTQSENRLQQLREEEASKAQALAERESDLGVTLAALQRIALQPPEAMLASPSAPADTVRGAMLLEIAIPAIETRARDLRGELDELTQVRASIEAEQASLLQSTETRREEEQRLNALIQENERLLSETQGAQNEAQARAAQLAEQAETLRELMDEVEAQRQAQRQAQLQAERQAEADRQAATATETDPDSAPDPELESAPDPAPATVASLIGAGDVRPFPTSPASLTLPARGTILLRYGETTSQGERHQGLLYATRPQARIVAPFDGQVVFAGEFRRYGQILIIEHGGTYHSLLAGLGHIDVAVGQWVLAGEPVAVMSEGGGGNPQLYYELRKAGDPIDPLPWLANNERDQG